MNVEALDFSQALAYLQPHKTEHSRRALVGIRRIGTSVRWHFVRRISVIEEPVGEWHSRGWHLHNAKPGNSAQRVADLQAVMCLCL